MTVTYLGYFDAWRTPQVDRVGANGRRTRLPQCQKIWNHSPDGFNWGYGGSGPAQLALALLFDMFRNRKKAVELHQDFKFAWVAKLPKDKPWTAQRSDLEAMVNAMQRF